MRTGYYTTTEQYKIYKKYLKSEFKNEVCKELIIYKDKDFNRFSDAELILEMNRRNYIVSKKTRGKKGEK